MSLNKDQLGIDQPGAYTLHCLLILFSIITALLREILRKSGLGNVRLYSDVKANFVRLLPDNQ